jgi:RNA polymerase sigma-70 factor (ECF subfamily)
MGRVQASLVAAPVWVAAIDAPVRTAWRFDTYIRSRGVSTSTNTARSSDWEVGSPTPPATAGFDPVRLIEVYQAGVWRYLRAMGCEASLADDLTQDTFLAVLQRPFQDVSSAATSAYLRKTALNLLISHQRRAGRVVAMEHIEELDQTWSRWAGKDNGDAAVEYLRNCLKRLTPRARQALDMRFQGELSRTDIATALNITEHGAKNLMQRAKQQLRQCVEHKLHEQK